MTEEIRALHADRPKDVDPAVETRPAVEVGPTSDKLEIPAETSDHTVHDRPISPATNGIHGEALTEDVQQAEEAQHVAYKSYEDNIEISELADKYEPSERRRLGVTRLRLLGYNAMEALRSRGLIGQHGVLYSRFSWKPNMNATFPRARAVERSKAAHQRKLERRERSFEHRNGQ